MRIIAAILSVLLYFGPLPSYATVLFSENFDSISDNTETQGNSAPTSCYSGCSGVGDFTAWNSDQNRCNAGVSNRPRNNNWYINSTPGYPDESTGTCKGGSGKCWTHWQESCQVGQFNDADSNFGIDLGSEQADVYLRFSLKLPTSFVLNIDQSFKLMHAQHYHGGGVNPWNYFGRDHINQPTTSCGIRRDGSYVDVYCEGRGYPTYVIHSFMFWRISTYTVAKAAGGILDGDWHTLEFRVRRNSAVNTADGRIELWVDGTARSSYEGYQANDLNFTNIATLTRSDISFNATTKTITSSAGDLSNEAFSLLEPLVVTGSASNNGTYTVVSQGSHSITVSENLTNESAGSSVTLTQTPSAVRGFRFLSVGGNNMTWNTECYCFNAACTALNTPCSCCTGAGTGTCTGSANMNDCEQWIALDDVFATTQQGETGEEIDETAPNITGFAIPAASNSLTVSISSFTATDAVGVTGYYVSESSETPAAGAAGWSSTPQTSYTFGSAGEKTLYAWAKDAAGNISSSSNDTVTITLPSAPTAKMSGATARIGGGATAVLR